MIYTHHFTAWTNEMVKYRRKISRATTNIQNSGTGAKVWKQMFAGISMLIQYHNPITVCGSLEGHQKTHHVGCTYGSTMSNRPVYKNSQTGFYFITRSRDTRQRRVKICIDAIFYVVCSIDCIHCLDI